MPLLARLEKLNSVYRNPPILKHQGGRERVIKYTSQEHTVFSALETVVVTRKLQSSDHDAEIRKIQHGSIDANL